MDNSNPNLDKKRLQQFKILLPLLEPHERPAIAEIIRQRAFRVAFQAFQAELDESIGTYFDEAVLAKLNAVRVIIER